MVAERTIARREPRSPYRILSDIVLIVHGYLSTFNKNISAQNRSALAEIASSRERRRYVKIPLTLFLVRALDSLTGPGVSSSLFDARIPINRYV